MNIKKLNEVMANALKEDLKPIKAIEPTKEQQEFLDEMKQKIENEEGISYGELADLQSLQPQIVYIGDVRLAEWDGIPEEVWDISESFIKTKDSKSKFKEGFRASLKKFDNFVAKEIVPLAPKLHTLKDLLEEIGAENRALSLEDVLDYLNL